MRHVFILTALVIFSFNSIQAERAEFYSAIVKPGENITNFLARFQLSTRECNIDLFCKINDIKDRNTLYASKEYNLPVRLYTHNGKSIRSSVGITDYQIAKKIEEYNARISKLGIKPSAHKKKRLVWVPMEEIECNGSMVESTSVTDIIKNDNLEIIPEVITKEDVPTTELKRKGIKEINVPLMGSKYETVNIEDFSLSGHVYYIISGHGGPDPGAMCTDCSSDLCEDEYAYDVALRLARNLMQHGATVHVIVQDKNDGIRDERYLQCDNDEKLLGKHVIPLNQKQRLKDRVTSVNSMYLKYKKKGVKVQKAIEIHVDSRGVNKRQDVYFYYNKNSNEGKKLAETVQSVFESKYAQHQKDRGYQGFVEERGLYMVRNLMPTTLFVELANIRNTDDQTRLLINTNRQALANWLFEGMRK